MLATVVAGAIAQRVVAAGWRAVTGSRPPGLPESPETRLVEAVAYSMLVGAVLNAARVVATRQAARYYAARSGGALPRALRQGTR
jgi:hypothetical protein